MPTINRRSRIALALAAAFASPAFAQLAPEATLKALAVGDGLAVQLFSAEPQFGNPCDMDIDAKGRVWVTEGWNYRNSKLRPAGDRIQVLEDTDGDGKADKANTFYQGPEINSALGICVLGKWVIVSCAPNVFLFEDKDGDLKADGPPKPIFTGIKGVQHDHAIHAFVFGPDGKLYFNFGNAGGQLKWPDGKPVIDQFGREVVDNNKPYRQGMVFRADFNPDTGAVSNVETLANNFRNNYEVAVDSFGSMWQSDNDDDGNRGVRINYVMEHGNYGYNNESDNSGWQTAWRRAQARGESDDLRPLYHFHQFDPGVVPNLLQTGAGSPTGICVYEGKLLPQQFWGQMIHCDAGPNVVRAYPVTPSGAGYKATIVNILQGGSDKWYRPSDVCVAPDGSIMVSDWYDPGVGGHATGDKPKAGEAAPQFVPKGRVYRVAPSSSPKMGVEAVNVSTAAGAIEALKNPNLATRYLGWVALNKMGKAAQHDLIKVWADTSEPRMRARALHLLARLQDGGAQYVTEALADKDADIRITGLRIARELKQELPPILKPLSKDPSAAVRREVAVALHGMKSPEVPAIFAELAAQHDGKDRWYLEALGIAAAGQDEACFEAYQKKVGDVLAQPGGADIAWRLRAPAAAPLVAKVILNPETPKARIPHLFRSFDFLRNDYRTDALLGILASAGQNKTILIETLSRLKNLDADKAAKVKAQVAGLLDASKGTPEFVQLVDQFDIPDRSEDLLAFVAAKPTDASVGTALRIVLKNDPKALERGLAGPDAAKITTALAAATSDRQVLQALENIVSNPKREAALRQGALTAMTRSKNGARAVLTLAEKGKLPDDAKPLAAALLHSSSHKDIQDDADKLFPRPAAKGTKLPAVDKLVAMKGDAARGRAVFTNATNQCSTCHVVNGQGSSYGPELSEIGAKLPKEALFTSIIYPNAGITMGFEGTILMTGDGDALDGIVISDTANEITLRRAGGITTPVKKSDVKERRPMKLSIMPEGLVQNMSQQDLVDLVEYLSTLKKAQPAK